MTTTAASKFRDMLLSKLEVAHSEASSSEASNAAKSRLSFSVDSLLKKKVSKLEETEDEDASIEDEDDLEEEDVPEDLSSNNNEVKSVSTDSEPKLAMPTPLMPNSMAALAASMRPQPHFLAAGIAAMAAAAAAANNSQAVTSSTTSTTSAGLPFTTNGGAWPPPPPGPPGPHLGFPFGIPGLRHPLFNTGMKRYVLRSELHSAACLSIIGTFWNIRSLFVGYVM